MRQAHDIITGRPSRSPREVSAEAPGVQVDGVFHGLIEAVAEKDRELARITAERAALIARLASGSRPQRTPRFWGSGNDDRRSVIRSFAR